MLYIDEILFGPSKSISQDIDYIRDGPNCKVYERFAIWLHSILLNSPRNENRKCITDGKIVHTIINIRRIFIFNK